MKKKKKKKKREDETSNKVFFVPALLASSFSRSSCVSLFLALSRSQSLLFLFGRRRRRLTMKRIGKHEDPIALRKASTTRGRYGASIAASR